MKVWRNEEIPPTGIVWGSPERITCRVCLRTSYHPADVRNDFCAHCDQTHWLVQQLIAQRATGYEHIPFTHTHARPSLRISLGIPLFKGDEPAPWARLLCSFGRHRKRRLVSIVPLTLWYRTQGFDAFADAPRFWAREGFELHFWKNYCPPNFACVAFYDCPRCGKLTPAKGDPRWGERALVGRHDWEERGGEARNG